MACGPYVPELPRKRSMRTRTHTHEFIIDLPIAAETVYRSQHAEMSLILTAYQCHYLKPVPPPVSKSLK